MFSYCLKNDKIIGKKLERMNAKRSRLIFKIRSSLTRKYLAAEDVAFVQKALVYAVDCHSGQFRKSGEPLYCSSYSGSWDPG